MSVTPGPTSETPRHPVFVRVWTRACRQLDKQAGAWSPPAGGPRRPTPHWGVLAVATAAFQRRQPGVPADRWQALCTVTSGLLLANTTRPYPPVW